MSEDTRNTPAHDPWGEDTVWESSQRVPRELESRAHTQREEPWNPPSVLPDPNPQPGYVFRYVRSSMVNQSDGKNVSMRFREGWEPCKVSDHPELQLELDQDGRFAKDGIIEIGGLILCKMTVGRAEQRARYYEEQSRRQMDSVDANLMREQDARMPLLKPERNTRTTFGEGSY